jgi:sugar (pentulose or hexulose) kinase
MDTPETVDPAAYARLMAQALGLPLEPDQVPHVAANLAVAFRLAALLFEDPLPDDLDPAPVYRAGGPGA